MTSKESDEIGHALLVREAKVELATKLKRSAFLYSNVLDFNEGRSYDAIRLDSLFCYIINILFTANLFLDISAAVLGRAAKYFYYYLS